MDNDEASRIAKIVIRTLYQSEIINGDQYIRALAMMDAVVAYLNKTEGEQNVEG